MINHDVLLLAHGSLHPQLRYEISANHIDLRENELQQETDLPQSQHVIGAYTWFYKGLRHPVQIWKMRRWLNQRGIPLFCWNQDAPHYLNYTLFHRRWRLGIADHFHLFDIYFTHTLIDTNRTFAILVVYLPNAANTSNYNLGNNPRKILEELRNPSTYRWDVTFFGGMNGSRYKEDIAREIFFAKLEKQLDILGISHCFRETDGMSTKEQVEFIQSSRINLNFGARCEYNTPVASGLPERCYGIPASGGFLLCDKRTHAQDDFTPGENWAEFDGIDDCITKIQYWLEHFDEARDLAERCHEHVMNHHTYAHRAKKVINAIHAWHEGKRGLIR